MGYYDHEGTYWPENRLIERLQEIQTMNRDFGSRAQGGGVPTDVIVEHGGAVVLSPEEIAAREAAWEKEQQNTGPPETTSAVQAYAEQPRTAPFVANFDTALLQAASASASAPLTILGITIDPPIIHTNKGLFPITADEGKAFKRSALGMVIASLTKAMEEADGPTGTDTP